MSLSKTSRRSSIVLALTASLCLLSVSYAKDDGRIEFTARQRPGRENLDVIVANVPKSWDPKETAVIICDMWNQHWCKGATNRVGEIAPRINELCKSLRDQGVLIIHAPSDVTKSYADHPARKRAKEAPAASNLPTKISSWCHRIPAEEKGKYPVDQTDGGCNCQPMCKQGNPWTRQIDVIEIADADAISDSGVEVWNLLESRGIKHILLCGVHTNMCVLGRPFGLRNLAQNGKDVVLLRDLTDTMYNSRSWPFVNHFTGNDRIAEHIEKFVCPTTTSDQIVGGKAARFSEDERPRLVMLIADKEYDSEKTLPAYANDYLGKDFKVDIVTWDKPEGQTLPGLEAIESADILLVSAWRRQPPQEQLDALKRYVASGKPVVGIRTASHAFARRKDWKLPEGHGEWTDFDRDVLGCHYTGHHSNKRGQGADSMVWIDDKAAKHPILEGFPSGEQKVTSWLYKVLPMGPNVTVLLMGRAGDRQPQEPVAWTNKSSGGGRVFYTSLGHPEEFQTPEFCKLLFRGIYWAAGLEIPAELPSTKVAAK